MNAITILLALIAPFTAAFVAVWVADLRKQALRAPPPVVSGIAFLTNFLDALGIGSFATTTSLFKLFGIVDDEELPGTLNVGITLPGILEAFLFISIVRVEPATLTVLIAAAIAGAWLGSGIVARWPRRRIQLGMGIALLTAAMLFLLGNLGLFPIGGTLLALHGGYLWFAAAVNFCLGAFMTLGIGLFAPCMILVSMLGMNPIAAFPIMMSSCAFLMPVASARFIRFRRYQLRAALGLTLAGIPGVLIAVFLVKALPLSSLRWMVIVVVVYAAFAMLRSAAIERRYAHT